MNILDRDAPINREAHNPGTTECQQEAEHPQLGVFLELIREWNQMDCHPASDPEENGVV